MVRNSTSETKSESEIKAEESFNIGILACDISSEKTKALSTFTQRTGKRLLVRKMLIERQSMTTKFQGINTYCSSSASLSDSSLVQFMSRFVKVFRSFFAFLFVLLEIGDGDIGFLGCVQG